ncbi:MAG TPA: SPOR domain-containing protein, partial [Chthoniobacterales bacterium]|nr:SPOR domain-containing protein [Chthoniobacterales bacterium]
LQWGPMRQPQPLAPQTEAAAVTPMPAPAPEPAVLNDAQSRRLQGYSARGHRLLSERLAAAREELHHSPDDRYSIELFETENSDPARMERFLIRARELVPLEELLVIPVASAGHYRLRVLYGAFASRDEATAAGKRLPPKYQQAFRTSVRSFGELRREI